MIPIWLIVLSVGMIALMFLYGVGFMTKRDLTLKLTGHTVAGAPTIVGARFFFLAGLGAVYLYLENIEALFFLLVLGVILAFTDAFMERRHGGAMTPHFVVGGGAAVLGYFYYLIYTTGAV